MAGTFLLKVNFRGMCTFVPDQDKIWVFLVNGIRRPTGVPQHGGFIQFPLDGLSAGLPDFGLWRMQGYDVRFRPLPSGLPAMICFDPIRHSCSKPENPDPGCFGFLANIPQACAARQLKCDGSLDPKFADEKNPLGIEATRLFSTRMILTGGTLKSTLSAFDSQLIESTFRPFNGPATEKDHRQVTAVEVAWETEISGDSISIEASRFRNGRSTGSITLRPADGELVLTVWNEDAETMLGMSDREEFSLDNKPRDRDRIFEAVYDICLSPPPIIERPIPVAERLLPMRNAGYPIVSGSPPCEPNTIKKPGGQ